MKNMTNSEQKKYNGGAYIYVCNECGDDLDLRYNGLLARMAFIARHIGHGWVVY